MITCMEVTPEALSHEVLNRRAPSRNKSHNGHQKPPRASTGGNKFPKFNRFVLHHMHQLGGTEVKAWIAIWKEEREGVSSISHQEVADRCGVARTNAIKAINKLVAKNLLRVVTKGNSSTWTTNQYTTVAEAT